LLNHYQTTATIKRARPVCGGLVGFWYLVCRRDIASRVGYIKSVGKGALLLGAVCRLFNSFFTAV